MKITGHTNGSASVVHEIADINQDGVEDKLALSTTDGVHWFAVFVDGKTGQTRWGGANVTPSKAGPNYATVTLDFNGDGTSDVYELQYKLGASLNDPIDNLLYVYLYDKLTLGQPVVPPSPGPCPIPYPMPQPCPPFPWWLFQCQWIPPMCWPPIQPPCWTPPPPPPQPQCQPFPWWLFQCNWQPPQCWQPVHCGGGHHHHHHHHNHCHPPQFNSCGSNNGWVHVNSGGC